MSDLALLGLALLVLALKCLQGYLQAPPPPQDEPCRCPHCHHDIEE